MTTEFTTEVMTPDQEKLLVDVLLGIHGGRELETFFFGDAAKVGSSEPKKLPLLEAFFEMLQAQETRFGWNASSPVPLASRILFHSVAKHFDRMRDKKRLRLYVATGISLDWHHHMDAVFACGRRFVGLDITTEWRVDKLDLKDAIIARCQLPIVLIPRNEIAVVGGFNAFSERIAERMKHELSLSPPSPPQKCWYTARSLAGAS
ncbi:MAG: hypothetical protein AAB391_00225 [Patescibacteria group bacterium]